MPHLVQEQGKNQRYEKISNYFKERDINRIIQNTPCISHRKHILKILQPDPRRPQNTFPGTEFLECHNNTAQRHQIKHDQHDQSRKHHQVISGE